MKYKNAASVLASSAICIVQDDGVEVTAEDGSKRNQRPSLDVHSSNKRNSSGHSVRLGNVCIRQYERTLGDNLCSSGPPIGIGWNYRSSNIAQTEFVVPLETYERLRGPRAEHKDLILSRFARESILIENGIARSQIAEAVRQNVKVKSQRRQTLVNLKMEPYEEALELWARNLRRALIFNKEARKKTKSRHLFDLNQEFFSSVQVSNEMRKGILIKDTTEKGI